MHLKYAKAEKHTVIVTTSSEWAANACFIMLNNTVGQNFTFVCAAKHTHFTHFHTISYQKFKKSDMSQ